MPTPTTVISPSPQQAAVYQWIRNGSGNAIIVAVAGSGKTTTLIRSLEYTTGPTAFAAFNKKIADEIKARTEHLPHVTAGTFHSFGYRAWRSQAQGLRKPSDRKMYKIIDENGVPDALKSLVKKAASLAKQSGFGIDGAPAINNHEAWLDLFVHFNLDNDLPSYIGIDAAITECIKVLTIAADPKSNQQVIDFDDMIWLPLLYNVRLPQFSWVMVDEAQDSNYVRRIFAERMVDPNIGRFIAVGDPHQAIYGFSGAMSDSLDQIANSMHCVELPLTVSFRCPKNIVAVAQQWVSHIESAPDAPDGIYYNYAYQDPDGQPLAEHREVHDLITTDRELLQPGTAVLCRNNAPIVSLAYKFIGEMIPCHVEGQDIGAGLIKLVRKYTSHTLATEMLDHLTADMDTRIQQLTELKKFGKIDEIEDQLGILKIIVENPNIGKLTADVITAIESLFRDSSPGSNTDVTLCSIHRSKGREWDRVIWYGREALQPSKFARRLAANPDGAEPWQLDQEYNLMYVAATRAKRELIELPLSR